MTFLCLSVRISLESVQLCNIFFQSREINQPWQRLGIAFPYSLLCFMFVFDFSLPLSPSLLLLICLCFVVFLSLLDFTFIREWYLCTTVGPFGDIPAGGAERLKLCEAVDREGKKSEEDFKKNRGVAFIMGPISLCFCTDVRFISQHCVHHFLEPWSRNVGRELGEWIPSITAVFGRRCWPLLS